MLKSVHNDGDMQGREGAVTGGRDKSSVNDYQNDQNVKSEERVTVYI